jgi:chromosome partitioning protein
MDQRSVRDLFVDESVPASACIRSARERLDFIASDTELALVEGELAMRPGMQRILAERLAPVLGNYDIVLLDCPPSLGVLSVNALTMAHEVIVPMQAQYLALRGLEKLLETVLLVERSLNPGITVGGVLLCMHESQSSHGRAVVEEIDRYFARHRGDDVPWRGAQVLKPPVRRNIKLAEAPSFGQTIFDYSPAADAVATESALASQ